MLCLIEIRLISVACTNLKWLSVVQNKLESMKGIDGLNKLTVLNAGKNKLKSMDDVKSISNLRALILNGRSLFFAPRVADNEITSVCKLDQMKELNTLVLSRNPISSLGESLVKLKSITKLSLSNCQLQKIDSSLRSCLELKELRLAHNEIMTIPDELGHLVRLQNLDLGNNLIARWVNLKVLSSLVNLTNLNLQGNPLAEKENLLKKVKKLLPNLHVFNARPIDKVAAKAVPENDADLSVEAGNKPNLQSEVKIDQPIRNKTSNKTHSMSESTDDLGSRNKRKELQDEKGIDNADNANMSAKKEKKRSKLLQDEINHVEALNGNHEEANDVKHKKKKSRKTSEVDTINNTDSAEMDLLPTGAPENPAEVADSKLDRKMDQGTDDMSVVVTYPTKKKNKKKHDAVPDLLELSKVDEIGLGGPSAWGV
ncbi:hypothetical protein SASPL_157459 [Salvia splendens]|uniref:Protein phosphatase 1 regulatory subunit 7 n=1 Tax=Salvia splendens TaxID=180675 RepID=A0A8X8VUX0_SALSN|nr:hypothetical protein SASPL_157459 [Salvia splendens]